MEEPKVMIMPHPDAEPPALERQEGEIRAPPPECPMEALPDSTILEMTQAMGAAFVVGALTGCALMWAFSKKEAA